MLGRKLYVSATHADGSFVLRGMASETKALEIFETFCGAREGGRAVFVLLTSHDGRLRARPSENGLFEGEVIARAARKAALFGLLPATSEIALRSTTFRSDEIEQIIHALYVLGPAPFRNLVEQEIAS